LNYFDYAQKNLEIEGNLKIYAKVHLPAAGQHKFIRSDEGLTLETSAL